MLSDTSAIAKLRDNIAKAIVGKTDVVDLAVVCLLSEGHLLIEDVPGVGKTTLARAMAASVNATWRRIQFTPDLLPSDVTGVNIWHQSREQFEFKPGGVFANFVIADEINRASPKTQAALLEVMDERRVTIDAESHDVTPPFMVLATQNPIDMDGTYPLPEAQLDRFLMRVSIGYPDHADEIDILVDQAARPTVESLTSVMTKTQLTALLKVVPTIHVAPELLDYVVRIVAATRAMPGVRLGASPRASLALVRAARAFALVHGRDYVLPDDMKTLAPAVLAHRLILAPEAELQGKTQVQMVEQVLRSVPVPQEPAA